MAPTHVKQGQQSVDQYVDNPFNPTTKVEKELFENKGIENICNDILGKEHHQKSQESLQEK